jgi:hypothetical protein
LVSRWSGEVAGAYITDPLPLEVTEIHFDPVDGPDAGAEDFEFVELHNRGNQPMDLTGVRLEGAVDFTVAATNAIRSLAAGGRGVVVSDRVAFAQRYPGVTPVLGEFSGRLANEGESLRVIGPLQEVVLAIPFSPAWLGAVADPGRSLVPIREGRTPDEASMGTNWVASRAVSGSPGKVDAASLPPARELRGALETGEVVLKITLEVGVAVEIQGRSVVGSGLWERAAIFPAGLAREERLAFLPSQAARFYRAVSVVE